MPATISFTARDATSSEYSPMFTTLQEDKFYIEKKLQQKINPPPTHTHTHKSMLLSFLSFSNHHFIFQKVLFKLEKKKAEQYTINVNHFIRFTVPIYKI